MTGSATPPASSDTRSDRPWRGGQLGLGLGILLAPLPDTPGLWVGAAAAATLTVVALRRARWPGWIPLAVLAAAAVGGALGTLADGPPAIPGFDRAESLRVLLRTVSVRALVGGAGFVGLGTLIVTRSRRGTAPRRFRTGWSMALWGALIVLGAVVTSGLARTYGENVPRAHLRAQILSLADAQRAYYATHQRFASRIGDLPDFQKTVGTLVIDHADGERWSARAWRERMLCSVNAEAPAPVRPDVACARDRSWFRSE